MGIIKLYGLLQSSIGIIGGADGPTSVFLAGSLSWIFIVLIALAVIGAVISVILLIAGTRKKRQGSKTVLTVCHNCGYETKPDFIVCPRCGHKLDGSENERGNE